MDVEVFKLGDNYLATNACERRLQIVIDTLKVLTSDTFNMEDLVEALKERGFKAEEIYINSKIQGW